MKQSWSRRSVHLTTLLASISTFSADAMASTGFDSPESGVVQVGRGGAWLAKADDPLAAYFNPAALTTQANGAHLGAHLLFNNHCFDRRNAAGETVSPGQALLPAPNEVCAESPPLPNPQLGVSYHISPRFALGLAVVAPHGSAGESWPETLVYEDKFGMTEHPSPQRYLLLEKEALAVFPTLSASFAVNRQLSFGAGFVWGLVALKFANMAEAESSPRGSSSVQPDDFSGDIRAQIEGFDAFVPGFVVSTQWSPHRRLDIAAWYRWSDKIKTKVDLYAQSNYFTLGGAVDTSRKSDPAFITDETEAGSFAMAIPMEARLGFRYRHPRHTGRPQSWIMKQQGYARDSMSQDLFDLELNLTWANNSAVDTVEVRMTPGIPINGTPGVVPENADVPHQWKDVLGVRLGGDYMVIPDLLALRAGGFFETKGVDDAYLNLDFHLAERIGVSGGATVRLGPIDLSLAYQHTFFGALDNGGQGALKALSGDAGSDFRTRQTINGGRAELSLNEFALGASYHF